MALQRNDNLFIAAPKPIDTRYGTYASVAAANAAISESYRYQGLTIGVLDGGVVTEYWYRDGTGNGDLIAKDFGALSNISDGSGSDVLIGNTSVAGDVEVRAQSSSTNANVLIIPKGTGKLQAGGNHTANISDNADLITKEYADNEYGFDKSNLLFANLEATVTEPYTFSELVTFNGGVVITGDVIEVNSEISTADAVIDMNAGEVGSGVTLGYSGLLVDRGTATFDYWIGYDESRDYATAGFISVLGDIPTLTSRIALMENSPSDGEMAIWDAANKRMKFEPVGDILSVNYGADGQLPIVLSGAFDYTSNFRYESDRLYTPALTVGNISASVNTITTGSGALTLDSATDIVTMAADLNLASKLLYTSGNLATINGATGAIKGSSIETGNLLATANTISSVTGDITLSPNGDLYIGAVKYPKALGTNGQILAMSGGILQFVNSTAFEFELTDGLGTTANSSAIDLNVTDAAAAGSPIAVKVDSGGAGTLFIDSLDIPIATLSGYQLTSEKGVALGYAPLDAGAKISETYLPDSILGQVDYQSTWNASTNTPTIPAAATANKGHYYVTSVAVAIGHGHAYVPNVDFQIGDWIISNGTSWEKVDNTDAVTTVFGRLGAVVAIETDYDDFYPILSGTYNNPTWLNQLEWSKITSTPTTLSGYGITDAQPIDTQLTSLAGLSYAGNSLKVVRVNAGETDFELATASGYSVTNESNNRILTSVSAGVGNAEANFTFDGTTLSLTGTETITGQLNVDNIRIDGNTISSTSSTLTYNAAAASSHIFQVAGSSKFSILNNQISINVDSIVTTGGAVFLDTSAKGILALTEITSAVNYLEVKNAITATNPEINAVGANANIGISLLPKGSGNVKLGTMLFDSDQTIGAGQDNYVLAYDHGTGLISLEAPTGGSGLTFAQTHALISLGI